MHRKPELSVACIKCSIKASYFKSEIVSVFIKKKKITLTPNLKEFNKAIGKLAEEVFKTGSILKNYR